MEGILQQCSLCENTPQVKDSFAFTYTQWILYMYFTHFDSKNLVSASSVTDYSKIMVVLEFVAHLWSINKQNQVLMF